MDYEGTYPTMSENNDNQELFHCITMPTTPKPEIVRDSILSTFDEILSGPAEILFVDGTEGCGKTAVLSQFIRMSKHRSFSIFIRNASRWAHDPQVLQRDLSGQILFFLDGQEASDDDSNPQATWSDCIYRLQRTARRSGKSFYFVVDGLTALPVETDGPRSDIIAILPFGVPGLKFLFSGSRSRYPELVPVSIAAKEFYLPGFSLEETRRFLSEIPIQQDDRDHLHNLTRGNPGKLSSIRRHLSESADPQSVVENLPRDLPSIFAIDWKPVSSLSEDDVNSIAIIAHERIAHSIGSLSATSGQSEAALQALIAALPFLEIEGATGIITFRSQGHRDYAINQLIALRDYAADKTIQYLLKNPESRDALLALPSCLREKSRFDDLLAYLSPEHTQRVVNLTHSWRIAQRHTDMGVEVACTLGRPAEALRFCIQESTLLQLEEAESRRGAVEAAIAIGDFSGARAVADSIFSHADRLHLLAIIERARKERGEAPDQDIINEIKRLFDLIDLSSIGEKGVAIASDLLQVDPDLSIQILRAGAASPAKAESREQALAQFTVEAFDAGRKSGNTDEVAKLLERLNDPLVAGFSSTVFTVYGGYGAKSVIAQARRISKLDARMAVFRIWCRENAKQDDAIEVVEAALEEIIRSTEYSPNARVFREIAKPLLYVKNTYSLMAVVSRLSSQLGTAVRLGPTIEYVRFGATLACAEGRYDEEAASSRLVELYLFIAELEDVTTKASCLTYLLALVTEFGSSSEANQKAVCSDCEKDLNTAVARLRQNTARHFEAVKNVLRPLARVNWIAAMSLAASLNTIERRDKARAEVVLWACRGILAEDDLDGLLSSLKDIDNPYCRNTATLAIVEHLARDAEMIRIVRIKKDKVIGAIAGVDDALGRCRAQCLLLSAMRRAKDLFDGSECDVLEIAALKSWAAVDVGWLKVTTGFNIVVSFAEHSIERAREILRETHALQDSVGISMESPGLALVDCIRLCTQMLGGLSLREQNIGPLEERVLSLINKITSFGIRAQMIADICSGYFSSRRDDLARSLVGRELKPCLAQIGDDNARYRAYVISYCAPVLYRSHQAQTHDILDKLSVHDRELAFRRISFFFLSRVRPCDPYDEGRRHDFDVDYDCIRDVLEVLRHIRSDYAVYRGVVQIVNTLASPRRKIRISIQQRDDVKRMLIDLIRKKFPSPTGVAHEGFAIIAQTQLLRLEQNAKRERWEELAQRGKTIGNIADISYVLGVIGSLIPSRWKDLQEATLTEALNEALKIPSLLDRLEHLEMLAGEAMEENSKFAKECILVGMRQGVASRDEAVKECREKMVDMAYRLDQDFASQLASLSDADPTKATMKNDLAKRLEVNQLRQRMVDGDGPKVQTAEEQESTLHAIDTLLGQLNAGKVAPKTLPQLQQYIRIAARMPFRDGYSIVTWVVANILKKYASSIHAVKVLRPFFEATITAAELSARMATGWNTGFDKLKASEGTVENESLLIGDGQREKAVSFLRQWLEREVEGVLRIFDPYFGPIDTDLVLTIRSISTHAQIDIITGRKHNLTECKQEPFESYYRSYWKNHVSEHEIANCSICIVGARDTGDAPFHDRYWLTESSGLRIGTSFGSLGHGKTSEISILSKAAVDQMNGEVSKYLFREIRLFKTQKVEYSIFDL